jgi:multidrug efflux pump subunit AcrB
MVETPLQHRGLMSRIVELFLRGNLSILLILISLIAGAVAMLVTPREEEPQIVVPLADVMVHMPGASAEEVEKQVSTRLERLLYQIDGVEYVYSMSRPSMAVVTVRFYVGEDREDSLIKLYNKIAMNTDIVPPGVTGWVVKPIEIDDVPIVNVTLWSERYDDHELRRIAEQVEIQLQSVRQTSRTEIVGGRRRQVTVEIDPERLAAHNVTALQVSQVLQGANVNMQSGSFTRDNREILVETGSFLQSANEIESLVVGVHAGRPVYVRDVALVIDGPEEPANYTRISFGPASEPPLGEASRRHHDFPAVTIAVAKQKGTNAVNVAHGLEEKLKEIQHEVIPSDVRVVITRNYGETADEKVNELVGELSSAIILVVGLVALTLGWREAIVVATAVPLTFSLTLLVNYLAGYTINRVTLFALILSLGLVVDDPIVDVENIFRHFRMRLQRPMEAVLTAVNEVRPPIILATLAVIISFLPLFFITGMMGPYMAPMALNVPMAMLMSMVVAFTVTPWLSYHVLRGEYGKEEEAFVLERSLTFRIYSTILSPLVTRRVWAWVLLVVVAALFVLSALLAITGRVPLKMLPFDNKAEFQLVIDMPEGTTVETTDEVLRALADRLREASEVTEVLTFAGTASPIDFNGMVRHYYLRSGPNVGDLRVNLLPKEQRAHQSHEILLRLRNDLQEIASGHGANLKLVEVPPGPPVIATLTAEIYGHPGQSYDQLQAGAGHVRKLLQTEALVRDVDDTVEDDQKKLAFVLDKEKASLNGINTQQIASTVRLAVEGHQPGEETMMTAGQGALHLRREMNPLRIVLRAPVAERSSHVDLEQLTVTNATGDVIQIAEFGQFEQVVEDKTIYHKNLHRVVYVFAELAGRPPAEAVLSMQSRLRDNPAPHGVEVRWAGEGEWKITLDVFRDLGIAFGAACLGIYVLLIWQTGSYGMPLLLMVAIPLTIIGILPGFWLLNLVKNVEIGGYPNPVFFTATGMIGMIALSGLATRNAILLIEFVHEELHGGASLRDALLKSGAVRFRPIFLTAGTAMLGAWPITLDPVFSGLAWSLIFGLLVSTAFTLVVVPAVYWLIYAHRPGHGLPQPATDEPEGEVTRKPQF